MFSKSFKIFLVVCFTGQWAYGQSPKTIDMNFSWRFASGEHQGAYQKDFDDSNWQIVDMPHDWSIADKKDSNEGPLDRNAIGQYDVGYTVGGTAWYRKSFKLEKADSAKMVHIQFDGIYMNSVIWVNNYHAASQSYGYSSFWLDITPYLKFGEENVIAVQVNNLGMNSRWYSGSGIYRPVSLQIINKIHFGHWGTAIQSSIAGDLAKVRVKTDIINETDFEETLVLESVIMDANGKIVGRIESKENFAGKAQLNLQQEMNIKNPALWSVDTPVLYTLVQKLKSASHILDQRKTTFGIRQIEFSAEKGFLLNGRSVLLKGSCMHHDNYMLGSAAYYRAEERRVELTKAAGYNAIRCAHNPPSQAFLDACDRNGILVIDEAFDQWMINKWDHDQDYGRHFHQWWQKDLKNMILRDRNHPSIIMWSIGNEIPEQGSDYGKVWAKKLLNFVKNIDPTRSVTMAVNNSGPGMDKFFDALDIVGYNYRLHTYESDQQRVPQRISYSSESFSRDAFDYWQKVEKLPYIIGDFVWTGWDYLGEASIGWTGYAPKWSGLGPYPWQAAYCGEIDLTGYKRPAAYYRDVLWKTGHHKVSAFVKSPEPSLVPAQDSSWNLYWTYPDIHPSWSWPGYEGKELQVIVYSACERVELFINGSSLGQKETSVETEYKTKWTVPYQPGVLKIVGFIDGSPEAQWILKTASKPVSIKLTADKTVIKADGQDLSYVTAELYDKDNNRVYNWNDDLLVNFKIEGQGVLAGIGNGHPASTESFQKPYRKTFRGRCVAVLKSTRTPGSIKVTGSAPDLTSDAISIKTVH